MISISRLRLYNTLLTKLWDCIGGVVVNVIASSAVDDGFEPRSGQTKDYKIGICCFSAKHTALQYSSYHHSIVPVIMDTSHHHIRGSRDLIYNYLTLQSVPITTKVVSSNPAHGEVQSIQHYVIKFVSDLRQVFGFSQVFRFPPAIKLIAMIQLKNC